MDNLNYLLKEIGILNSKYKHEDKDKEIFNIFDSMMKRTDERYLHSKFISILLDPTASHKAKDKFLKLFLNISGIEISYDLDSLCTYPNERDSHEYKNMDILVIDRKNKSAVIIENKIYAEDSNHEQEGQLEKYYRIVLKEEKIPEDNIHVVYLSLDRKGPSEESVWTSKKFPKLAEKVININYNNEILKWLESCAKECYDKPMLRETINQYKNLIEIMTNKTASEERISEIMNVIGRNRENLAAARLLINHQRDFQFYSILNFWEELTNMLASAGFIIRNGISESDCEKYVFRGSRSKNLNFNLCISTKNGYYLTVNLDYNGCLCVGASDKDGKSGLYNHAKDFFESNQHSLSLETEPNWIFFKVIEFSKEFSEEWNILDFKDYQNELFFNLISESERNKIVNYVYQEVKELANQYSSFRK